MKEGHAAFHLTSQLLGFIPQQPLHDSTVDANRSIQGLMEMLRPLLGKHIQVTMELDEAARALHVDTALIEQMLANTCLNARDTLRQGGDLTKVRIYLPAVTDVPALQNFDREIGLCEFAEREGLPILIKPFQPASPFEALREAIDMAEAEAAPMLATIDA